MLENYFKLHKYSLKMYKEKDIEVNVAPIMQYNYS